MQQAKISDLHGIINKIAPPSFAEEWDNSGLQVGDPSAPVERVMVALDPLPDAVAAAIENSCQLLVTHHPLIFSALKRISTADQTGSIIHQAISNRLAIIAAHTNYDIAANGVNDLLARRLGIVDCQPLRVTRTDELLKLTVFVPESHEQKLLDVLLQFGGILGKYGECSFRVSGLGTFKPLEGAKPFLGSPGTRETVSESRLEILVRAADKGRVLKALLAAHPYEEPAFDLVRLVNEGSGVGLGRIGNLVAPVPVDEFVRSVKELLGVSSVRIAARRDGDVSRVALCGGSGVSLLRDGARQGADIFVTGDMKYHEAREAEALGITVIDAGHFATERLMIEGLCLQLAQELAQRRLPVAVMPYCLEKDPFEFV